MNEFDDPELGRLLGRYAGGLPDSAEAYPVVQRRITRARRRRAATWTAGGVATLALGTAALAVPRNGSDTEIIVGNRSTLESGSSTSVPSPVTDPTAVAVVVTATTVPGPASVAPPVTPPRDASPVSTSTTMPGTPATVPTSSGGTTAPPVSPPTTSASQPGSTPSVAPTNPSVTQPSSPTTSDGHDDDEDDHGGGGDDDEDETSSTVDD